MNAIRYVLITPVVSHLDAQCPAAHLHPEVDAKRLSGAAAGERRHVISTVVIVENRRDVAQRSNQVTRAQLRNACRDGKGDLDHRQARFGADMGDDGSGLTDGPENAGFDPGRLRVPGYRAL